MKLKHFLSNRTLAVIAVGALLASTVHATTFQITLNTSALSASDKWYLDYQLVASDLPAENSVTLSNFSFAGGAYTGNQTLSGNVSGSESSAYILTDPANLTANNVSELLVGFTPGSQVTFDLTYTDKFSSAGSPDAFFWAVEYCDPTSQACALPLSAGTAPSTIVNPLGPSLGASIISTLDGVSADAIPEPFAATSQFNFITPTVTPLTAVPEPSAGMMLCLFTSLFLRRALCRRP